MKNLKDYIKENREAFDDQEPAAGHFERFEQLLDKQTREEKKDKEKKTEKRIYLTKFISVAASIAILFVVGIKLYQPNRIIQTDIRNIENPENQTNSDEFATTNEYYRQLMEAQIADIMCKLSYTDSENQSQLSTDLEKIIRYNKDFLEEIATSTDEELAIYYLIKHYKANIEALENINEKLGKYTKC